MTAREIPMKEFTIRRPECFAVIIRELQVRDDIEIALQTDRVLPQAARESGVAILGQQKKEAVRLSIVAIVREPDGAWERVTQPFADLDDWSHATYTAILTAHAAVNGITGEDFLKGAVRRSSAELATMIGTAPAGASTPGEAGSAAPAGG